MRASRLLSILLLLQTRGRLTARQLADELEVSVRTVYRDLESLSSAGVPVYADRGATGGYQLVQGFRTRLTGLTEGEAGSLFLAGLPGPAAELGLGEVVAAAELKLLAALPPELRSRASRIRERFHLDAPAWFRDADRTTYLATIGEAVWQERRVRVRYRRWDNSEVTRELEPLGLILKAGRWYLAAGDESGSVRSYRVSRMLDVQRTTVTFERPEDFDLAAFWASTQQSVRERLYRGEAEIRLSPRGRQLSFLLDAVVAAAVREGVRTGATQSPAQPDTDGWVRLTVPMETVEHATRDLLRLGAEVEVLAPQELRDNLARTADAIAERYRRAGES